MTVRRVLGGESFTGSGSVDWEAISWSKIAPPAAEASSAEPASPRVSASGLGRRSSGEDGMRHYGTPFPAAATGCQGALRPGRSGELPPRSVTHRQGDSEVQNSNPLVPAVLHRRTAAVGRCLLWTTQADGREVNSEWRPFSGALIPTRQLF